MKVYSSTSKFFSDKPMAKAEIKSSEQMKPSMPELDARSKIPKQPNSSYETRRIEIAQSNEQIEGVFYIVNGQVVPDYYSECLFSEVDSDSFSSRNQQNSYKCAMLHSVFYKNYIQSVYEDIAVSKDENSLPRGRVQKSSDESASIIIDKCYYDDEDMIKRIIELYRLSGKVSIVNTPNYLCPNCVRTVKDFSYMQYTWMNGMSDCQT